MGTTDKTLAALLDLGNFASRRTRSEQIEDALRTAMLITEADAAVALAPSSRRGERLVLHAGSEAPAIVPGVEAGSEVSRVFSEDPVPVLLADLSEEARFLNGDRPPGVDPGPAMFVPLRQRDPSIGYLAVFRRRGRARFTNAERNAVLLLATCLGMALEAARLAGNGGEKLAVSDGLTEVYNARFLRTALRRELRRASRFGQELSLVRVELDAIESQDGEPDDSRDAMVLRELAGVLSRQVRSFDLVARLGAREFALMLPQTGRDGAVEVAERTRAAVEQYAFSVGPAGTVTVTCGVAVFPREGSDEKALLASSQRALGQARRIGPNRVGSLDLRVA